jgi:hypothetical protein
MEPESKRVKMQLADFPRWLRGLFAVLLILLFFNALYAFAFLTSFFATWSWRIDPGVATLIGAIVGLGIVAWQARLGFTNLIRSQENQAVIEMQARLHQHQLDIDRERQGVNEDRRILMSALRAEIVGLMQQASRTMEHANMMRAMLQVMAEEKAPDLTRSFTWPTFQAPVYQASLSKMGYWELHWVRMS